MQRPPAELHRFAPPAPGPRPFWSVMVPTFNRSDLLEKTLRSLLAQNIGPDDMQIEVVDNASDKVDVGAIVKAVGDGRIGYFRQERNIGAFPNFHTCIERSRGFWVHILSDDDLLLPGFHSTLREALEKAPDAGMAVTGVTFIDEHDRQIGQMPPACTTPGIIDHWLDSLAVMQRQQVVGTVVKRSVYEAVGGFRLDIDSAADWEMWIRIAAKYPVWGTPQNLASFRLHQGSWSSAATRQAHNTRDTRRVIEAVRSYLPPERAEQLTAAGLAHYAISGITMAQQFLQSADLAGACAQLREALLTSTSDQVLQATTALAQTLDQYAAWLAGRIEQLAKNPDGDAAAVRGARRELANALLALPDDQVERTLSLGIGKIHAMLATGHAKLDAAHDLDPAILREFDNLRDAKIAASLRGTGNLQRLMVAMLYVRPDELSHAFDLPAIPQPLIDAYLRFVHEPPSILMKIGEADAYAAFVDRWVAYLHENALGHPDEALWRNVAVYFAQAGHFIAYYFNYRNLRDTYRRRAEIIETVLRSLGHAVDYSFPARDTRRTKIRLGILSAHYNPQTETFATLPFYKNLNRELFEIVLITAHQSNSRLERYCTGHADALIAIPQGQLPQQVQAIRQLDLDLVLIATNVTAVTNPITLLAVHRLARVQVNSVCSCVTSGMSNNDYYISGKSTEPADDPQAQYHEKLRLIDGPAHCCDFGSEEHSLPTQRPTRESLGISADAIVFASGSNFYKVIPEVEDVWVRVLERVANSRLILYPFNPNWSNAYPSQMFVQRLHASMAKRGIDAGRLTVFPPVAGRGDILERLKLADVYLDSFPFSGITSLIDPLEIGLPPVVMEGNSFRSLMAPALMRELQIPELIARDADGYVDLAVRLAGDADLRRDYSRRVREGMVRNPKFQNSRWYSGQVEKLLTAMLREKGVEIPVLNS